MGMHAIEIIETGGPEVLRPAEVPIPEPGPGMIRVRIEATGVNFIETYQRSGAYPVELPHIPGSEAVGVVDSVGPPAADADPGSPDRPGTPLPVAGDRVAFATGIGTYARYALVPAAQAVPVPAQLDAAVAASALLQGMTAHYLVHDTYRVCPGDTVLVHAGAGGVGQLLTQMAVARGARVLTTVSTEEKAEISRARGADEVLDYRPDLAERVRALTDGRGVDAVYDGVGAATVDQSLAALRLRGTLALFGAASGPVPPLDPQRLNAGGSLFLTRPTLAHHVADRAALLRRGGEVLRGLASGELTLQVGGTYPLAEAARAHSDLEARRTTGSIVLLP